MSFGYRGDLAAVRAGDGLTFGHVVVAGPHRPLDVIFSDGLGWEHVSVSTRGRCPNWPEMCLVKNLFWSPEDCVIQYHPPEAEYVNDHPYCLHLWRPQGVAVPIPPRYLIGTTRKQEADAILRGT